MQLKMRMLIVCGISMAVSFGQPARDSYRVPYKTWKQSSASLERDAAAPTVKFGAQEAAASKAAQDFLNARISFLSDSGGLAELSWAGRTAHADTLLAARSDVHRLLARTDETLAKAITSFAGTKDTALQEVRQAMERERAALNELIESLNKREALVGGLTDAISESERIRSVVTKMASDSTTARDEIVKSLRVEGVAWARYYADLAEGAGSPPANK